MNNEKTIKEIKEIFENYTKTNLSSNWMTQSMEELGLNSFDAISLLIDIEENFDIIIDDNLIEPEMFSSPQSMYDIIKKTLNK